MKRNSHKQKLIALLLATAGSSAFADYLPGYNVPLVTDGNQAYWTQILPNNPSQAVRVYINKLPRQNQSTSAGLIGNPARGLVPSCNYTNLGDLYKTWVLGYAYVAAHYSNPDPLRPQQLYVKSCTTTTTAFSGTPYQGFFLNWPAPNPNQIAVYEGKVILPVVANKPAPYLKEWKYW